MAFGGQQEFNLKSIGQCPILPQSVPKLTGEESKLSIHSRYTEKKAGGEQSGTSYDVVVQ